MNRRDRMATATLAIEAEPASTMALLADAARIPQWMPAFGGAVRVEDGSACRVIEAGRRVSLRVAVDLAGTVDFLPVVAPGVDGGTHFHVASRPGGGSVVDMSVPVAVDEDPAVAAVTLRAELTALARSLASRPR